MKKLITLLITFSLCVSIISYADFTDTLNHWAKSDIQDLVDMGSINGYPNNTFKPNDTIKRGEFIKTIVSMEVDAVASATGHWASGYYQTAQDEGLLPQGIFGNLDMPITRAEITLMISSARPNLKPYSDTSTMPFNDISDLDSKYAEATLKVYMAGIITGYPDSTFRPNALATRAEAATLLMRMHDSSRRLQRN